MTSYEPEIARSTPSAPSAPSTRPSPPSAPHPTDFFEILKVSRDATSEEIRKSYNELVLLHHPDKGGDILKFKDIQTAYKILSNKKNREIYTKSLAATFTEMVDEYRDKKTGKRVAMTYDRTCDDFASAETDYERRAKRELFMNRFEASRDAKNQQLMAEMKRTCEAKITNAPVKPPTYQELLEQEEKEQEQFAPAIDCLKTGTFDINLFNQLFEKNKQSQAKEMEPYQKIEKQYRRDLAPINDSSIFADGFKTKDQDASNREFSTYAYKINPHISASECDLSRDVTDSRSGNYQNPEDLLAQFRNERNEFLTAQMTEPPKPIQDDNELSYQQMDQRFTAADLDDSDDATHSDLH